MKNETIKCPNCGEPVDVNSILYHQLEEQIKKDFNSKLADEKKKFEQQNLQLQSEKEKLEKEKSEIQQSIEKGIREKLSSEKLTLEKKIRAEITEEKSEEITSIKQQLDEKIQEAKAHNKLKADFERLQREKSELQEKIEAESEQKLTLKLNEAKEKIAKEAQQGVELKIAEKDHVINQLMEQLKEAQRKGEQGSMQTQGEVQELLLEEYLRSNFVLDLVEEVKKGARGADCLQVVNTRTKMNCGSIYYESKRTKEFSNAWIEKFKADMREKGATFGVLVTEAMPKGIERMTLIEGIWICSYEEMKGLSFVLRESVILLSTASEAQENKGSKMEMLYAYLTSNEFKMQVEAIVEGFTQMDADIATERRAMESSWKRREKQIQKVKLNTIHMHASIKAIAGNAIASIQALELPEHTDDEK